MTARRSTSSGSLDRVDDDVDGRLEQSLVDGQRRADLDDVLVWPADADEHAALERGSPDRAAAVRVGRARRRGRSRSRCRRTGRDRGPRRRAGRRRAPRASRPSTAPEPRGALPEPLAAHDLDRRPGPAARFRALPMNVDVWVPGAQWPISAARPTTAETRQPAADALADGHEVRARRPSARPPTAGRSARTRTGSRRR